jgi:acetyl-CoA acetyltransferase
MPALTRKQLEAAFFSNTFWGMFANQHSIRGQVVLRSMGIEAIPVTNVENACAGASTALHLAYTGIRAGMYDVALAVGSEKITDPDKMKSLSAYATCMDVDKFGEQLNMMEKAVKSCSRWIFRRRPDPAGGRALHFHGCLCHGARWHMNRFGSTQRQLAVICAKNHFHGSLNPMSQYQMDMTVEEVLADKPIAYPLTRAMCAPVGDGAAAAIVCSEAFLKKLTASRPIRSGLRFTVRERTGF